jgi:putative DNA primase/helicase
VAVVEGEKKCGRAARVFPESVCTSSPGGSQAASKAEWSPLAGRKVLMWPDCDEPGEKYGREVVAHILHGLRCEVSIIEAAALASLAPDGGQREPVKGWDAADAIGEWQDLAALRKAAHGLAKPYEAGPHEPKGEDELNTAIGRLAAMYRRRVRKSSSGGGEAPWYSGADAR